MFFGLRLVFAVILSDPILGSTVIQTGVQVRTVRCHAVCLFHECVTVGGSGPGGAFASALFDWLMHMRNAFSPCRLLAS